MADPRIGNRAWRAPLDPSAGLGAVRKRQVAKLAASLARGQGPGFLGSSQQRGSGSTPVPPGAMGRETLFFLPAIMHRGEAIGCGRRTPLSISWLGVGARTRYCDVEMHVAGPSHLYYGTVYQLIPDTDMREQSVCIVHPM